MCNLNVVYSKCNKDTHACTELVNALSLLSFQSNAHGDGAIFRNQYGDGIQKGVHKQIYRGNHHLIISHQRYATQGAHNDLYAQPIETPSFYIVHNGVLSLHDGEHSDSYIYAQRLEDAYKKHDGVFKKALCSVHRDLIGYFSIFIYERKNRMLWYLKNDNACFFYVQNSEYFAGCTTRVNIEYARDFLEIETHIKTPKAYKVYDVLNNFKATFTIPKYGYYDYSNKWGDYDTIQSALNRSTWGD